MPSSLPDTFRPRFIIDLISAVANQASLVTLYSFLIMSTSVFIYITLYNTYVPVVQHSRPVHLQFDSTCRENCSNPFAIVNFNDVRSSFYLARGQSYRFVIALEMPESEINWKQGMFMIRLRLIESQGKTLYDISRPAILKYKSLLTRMIHAIFYWFVLVTGYRNEMQTMNVQLIDNYIEGAKFYFNKMDRALVEILARDVQIYSAHLHVLANLSGISYYMYHWPVTSAAIGISTLASFMAILSVYRGHSSSGYRSDDQYTDTYEDYDNEEDKEYENEEKDSQVVDSSTDSIGESDGLRRVSNKAYFTREADDSGPAYAS